jgi:pimeloyl-ACP methyl ester carboxylesterase
MIARKSPFLTAIALLFVLCRPLAAAEEPQFFDADGVSIRYVDMGQGEPVVLVHGFAANFAVNWAMPGTLAALSKDYRVIALDVRGHGGSEKPHDDAKYGEEMADDVIRLLDHLKIERAHLVGYSMGAFITNNLVARHPQRILSATLGGGGWMRANDERMLVLKLLAESLEKGEGITPLLIALSPSGLPKRTVEQTQLTNRMLMLANDQQALAAVARTMSRLAVTEEQLKANRVPVLAIIGEVDPLKVGVDELEDVMPNLDVVVIDKGDHLSTLWSPKFVESVKGFLAAHRAGSGTAN